MNNFAPERASDTVKYVVAIVDDEEDLRLNIGRFLESQGFTVWSADSAESFYRQMVGTHADLVIVDLGLPGEDGLTLISHLNSYGRHAVIALTARGELSDRIAGLEAGADYYFVKPVDLFELAAGINAVLRKRPATASVPSALIADSGIWSILRAAATLMTPHGITVGLTFSEVRLLEYLIGNPEKVFSKEQLLDLFDQNPDITDFHRIEVLISRLRIKVMKISGLRLPVRAVFGKGLAFVGRGEVKT